MTDKERKEIAEIIVEKSSHDCNVWLKEEDGAIKKLRVYFDNRGYAEVTSRGVDINNVKSNFMEVKEIVENAGYEAYRF